jgi:hypothetical protein
MPLPPFQHKAEVSSVKSRKKGKRRARKKKEKKQLLDGA